MAKSKKLPTRAVLSARGIGEFYGVEPHYVVLDLTPGFLKRLKELMGLCKTHRLAEIKDDQWLEWGPPATAEDLRLNMNRLVVSDYGFWCEATVKHADTMVNSGLICNKGFFEALAEVDGDTWFEDQDTRELYEDAMAAEAAADAAAEAA